MKMIIWKDENKCESSWQWPIIKKWILDNKITCLTQLNWNYATMLELTWLHFEMLTPSFTPIKPNLTNIAKAKKPLFQWNWQGYFFQLVTKSCKLEPRPKVLKLFCQRLGGDRFEIIILLFNPFQETLSRRQT